MGDEPASTQTAESSFDSVYRAERPGMVRLAHLLTGSNAVAEEIVQDAFLELHRRWSHVANPKAYVTRTVVNRAHSHHRKLAVRRRQPPIQLEPTLIPEIDETWQAVLCLPVKRRTALVLRYYEDLSIAQTAAAMGIPEGTVKSLVHRALNTLKERLT